MAFALPDLVRALALAPDGADRFAGSCPDAGWQRVFGGFVLAQALLAMGRTADGRGAHALHANFVAPGDPGAPIRYAVERLRDGASFATRRCVARQGERAIFAATASFHSDEPGAFDHAAPMPPVPAPEELPPAADALRDAPADLPPAVRAALARGGPIELRFPEPGRFARRPPGPHPARQAVWMRAAGALPDDPALHRALLAYMSDLALLDTALAPHGRTVFDPDVQAASLDHALWFHRPARADGWLLHSADSPSAAGARGFARGSVFDRSGALVASTAQEGLIRLRAGR